MNRYHDQLVQAYRAAVAAQEQRAEDYSYGYATETADFYATVEPKITFKQFLISQRADR